MRGAIGIKIITAIRRLIITIVRTIMITSKNDKKTVVTTRVRGQIVIAMEIMITITITASTIVRITMITLIIAMIMQSISCQ